jgi:hypothetical protein
LARWSPHASKPVTHACALKKTRFPRSTGVRCSRARCSLIEKSDRVPVLLHRLERAHPSRSSCNVAWRTSPPHPPHPSSSSPQHPATAPVTSASSPATA